MPDPLPPESAADLRLLRRSCEPCTLRQFCLCAEQQCSATERLSLFGKRMPISRGERLFRPGDPQASIYVVRSGALKTVVVGAEGEHCVLGFHVPGELVGLDALATGAHLCEAVALTETHVCAIPYSELTAMTAQSPDLNRQLLQLVGNSALDCQRHVQMLMRRHAGERIAMFLHGLLQRYHRGGMQNRQLMLPMSRDDVAHFLGLALETVSRGFSRLQAKGVIEVSGRQIHILDREALAQLTQPTSEPELDDEPRLDHQHG